MKTVLLNRPSAIVIAVVLCIATVSVHAETIRVACYRDYSPYASVDDESHAVVGVLADIWHVWSEKSGIDVELVPMGLDSGINAVVKGSLDAHCGLFYSEERAQSLGFTDALARTQTILFLRKDIPPAGGAWDVPVSVVKGDFAVRFFRTNRPGQPLREYETYEEMLAAVDEQAVPAFVYEHPRAFPGYKPVPPPDGYRALEVLYSERLRPAVKRGNTPLAEKINAGLAKISDEEFWEIASAWKFYQRDDSLFLLFVGAMGAVLVMLLAAVLYIRKLRGRLKRGVFSSGGGGGDWRSLVRGGESDAVEYKSSLRWDLCEQRVNKELEQVIAKTVSAFLNADGGILLIGVDDDGGVLGLESDYRSFTRKPNADGFLLGLSSVINNMLGKKYHRFIRANIVEADGKDICLVSVRSADGPVFFRTGNREEFYIRAQASSQPLGLKETHEYIVSKWSSKRLSLRV